MKKAAKSTRVEKEKYTTDFKIFRTSENVRTCARMQEKGMLQKYLKGYKYKYFKLLKKPIKL